MSDTYTPSTPRLWIFRLTALLLVPVAFLAGAELMLRVGGVGYDPGFLVEAEGRMAEPANDVLTTNRKFGWRFFPRALARAPVPLEIEVERDVVRLAVVGGSAARGTPDPAFGLPRLLEEILLDRQVEEVEVRVENAAMTAINSHVARSIVDDLLASDEAGIDVLVIYLGNNEVVGPFGAATVFSPFSPHLGMIRASTGLKRLRVGQVLSALVTPEPDGYVEWRGMEMFLDQQIRASDPRLEDVYAHFGANLEAMIRRARSHGVEVVLSTVATNLRHQPPFASLHREDLDADGRARCDRLSASGRASLDAGDPSAALAALRQAVEIDSTHAETRFHLARALLASGDTEAAHAAFVRARDLDTLRFRADSRINEVIRRVAAEHDVSLVDAAQRFAGGVGSHGPLPGRALFFEHVHLNFEGNVALANEIASALGTIPGPTGGSNTASNTAPSARELARRLPFTPADALHLERSIVEIVSRPPFTATWGHAADLQERRRQIALLRRLVASRNAAATHRLYEARLEARPDDLLARRRLAEILQERGEAERAAEHWRHLLDRLPDVPGWLVSHAAVLADLGEIERARAELEAALERWPEERVNLLLHLGSVAEKEGDAEAAAVRYREAARAEPGNPLPAYNLATLAARRGDLDEAITLFRRLVEEHPSFHRGHHNLGVAHEARGDLDAAAEAYEAEIEADPNRPQGHASLGVVREAQGRAEAAVRLYSRALDLDPGYAPARFHLADFLLARGRPAEAATSYREGLALEPGNVQAATNLRLAEGLAERLAAETP